MRADRSDNVVRLDPNWVRRRQNREESSPLLAFAVITLAALALAWVVRTEAELGDAQREAKVASQALSAKAVVYPRDEKEVARLYRRATRNVQGSDEGSLSGSSINGKELHRCVIGGVEAYVSGACPDAWLEAPQARGSTRAEQVYEQDRMRARADALLAQEQRRFNALTGAGQSSWSTGQTAQFNQCAFAKAQRDEAYRIVGNDRTFEFIRKWDDIVYNACKNG